LGTTTERGTELLPGIGGLSQYIGDGRDGVRVDFEVGASDEQIARVREVVESSPIVAEVREDTS
jgi:hypothetical protein